ncbi:isoleucine--tRNA ligase [Synechococcus sp. CBW1004]|uniref:isoleucine--tRNA ligase n=1 Tax=Synechococcus sp. CBW1004 TaxID=1353136 RepID=UPI001E55ED2F|nr:isoleucine--tRNA ligase [Synechococcus sp. CBW1004]
MRANARQREPELQSFWAGQRLYERLSRENRAPDGQPGEPFTLHDGPPYANGALHVGHALNKILKDVINKHALMRGRRARFVPGWDCHGLPIELKVLQGLSQDERRSLTPLDLRRRAHAYALEQVELQRRGFRRWGIWADWDAPYLTLNKDYEAAQIGVFGRMVLAGHIYRGLKPVHWSPSSRTALAEAELEYPEGHTSPSVYVAFPVVELPDGLAARLEAVGISGPIAGRREQLFVAIWTTTPWTLPANLAVSVNGALDYCICLDGSSAGSSPRYLVVAQELVETLQAKLERPLQPLLTLRGAELEGLSYRHPLLERTSPVVIGGDYITTESGTGLVHTAPGHGVDDFNTGRQYGLPVLCPVDEAGNLTDEAGPFAGLNVLKDANAVIITALRDAGALLAQESYAHRYPYDWRTKKPTIFRATEQWFASVEGFRQQALEAIDRVTWLPESGRNRIEAMVRDRGDWCISRQRTWGVPIPVFYHRETGEVLLNEGSLAHIQALIAEHGSDVWWEKEEAELLPPSHTDEAHLWRKGTDTMDVWFDSGSSWAGVLGGLDGATGSGDGTTPLCYPADLYLEGSDQHRGWFQSSLLTSVAVNGTAPYRTVLTHGFTLDEKGRKMSKSLGNVVDPAVLVEGGKNEKQEPAYGADVLRLWVSSVDYSADVPLGPGIVKQLADVYRKVRNTARYLLGNLHDFDPSRDAVPVAELPLLDRWMLQRTASLIDEVTADFERFEFYRFFQALQNFCVVDLSNFYLDIAKDRLYVSGPSDFRRRSCQTVLALVVERLAGLIAPVLCHMAEDIWQNLPYPVAEASVFERGWPTASQEWRQAISDEESAALHQVRDDLRPLVNRLLESGRAAGSLGASLEARVQLESVAEGAEAAISLDQLQRVLAASAHPEVDNLADWLLVSELHIGGEAPAAPLAEASEAGFTVRVARADGEKCERCWHYESDVADHRLASGEGGRICGRCRGILTG